MATMPIALVTGATSGIGAAIARRLHDRGHLVYAVGRNPAALEQLRADGLRACSLDITDGPGVQRLIDEIDAEHGGVDVLVNCAGFPLTEPLEQVPLESLRGLFEANVVGALRLSQAVLPRMRARGAGRIVNIGSTAGRFASPVAGPYHVVKHALEAMSLALRAEVAPFGVKVVLLDPTGVWTPFVTGEQAKEHDYPDDDPYGALKRSYAAATNKLTETRGVMISAETVAKAVTRVVAARNPRPRYVVGLSGKATLLARRLLTDRMWDRVMLRQLGH